MDSGTPAWTSLIEVTIHKQYRFCRWGGKKKKHHLSGAFSFAF
ncbi:hypothetical protein [Lactobacillus jensenii]